MTGRLKMNQSTWFEVGDKGEEEVVPSGFSPTHPSPPALALKQNQWKKQEVNRIRSE
jgi:hypothetical protein